MGRFTTAQRRYTRRIIILSLIYVVVVTAATLLIMTHTVTGPLAYAIGIAPGLLVSGFFLLLLRYLTEETDEYQRLLQARQMLIATGILLTCCTVWGFLEGFRLAPHLVAWNWSFLWFIGLGIGGLINVVIERRAA